MARTLSGRQKHPGESDFQVRLRDEIELGAARDYRAKEAAKAQADLAVATDVPTDEHWQDGECSCYELPDGRSYTCPACAKRQHDEDLATV